MTYLAAYLLMSLIGCAVWFLLTPFTEDEYADEKIRSHDGRSLRPVHIGRTTADAGEENDAALGSLLSKAARGK